MSPVTEGRDVFMEVHTGYIANTRKNIETQYDCIKIFILVFILNSPLTTNPF
jgi:hypothetical protein